MGTTSATSSSRSRQRTTPAVAPETVTLNARASNNVRGPLMTTGQVVAQMPYSRVVEVAQDAAVGGRIWVVQATFMSAPESDGDWTTIATSKAHDGRMGSRGRKVYPTLRKTAASAKSDAEQYMANASQCLSVESPLFVAARSLLVEHDRKPPFAAVRDFLLDAEASETGLRREIAAGSRLRAGSSGIPYFSMPPVAMSARLVLLAPNTIEEPIAFDGLMTGRFEAFAPAAAAE